MARELDKGPRSEPRPPTAEAPSAAMRVHCATFACPVQMLFSELNEGTVYTALLNLLGKEIQLALEL